MCSNRYSGYIKILYERLKFEIRSVVFFMKFKLWHMFNLSSRKITPYCQGNEAGAEIAGHEIGATDIVPSPRQMFV